MKYSISAISGVSASSPRTLFFFFFFFFLPANYCNYCANSKRTCNIRASGLGWQVFQPAVSPTYCMHLNDCTLGKESSRNIDVKEPLMVADGGSPVKSQTEDAMTPSRARELAKKKRVYRIPIVAAIAHVCERAKPSCIRCVKNTRGPLFVL